MNRLLAGAAALNQTPLDWDGNRDNLLGAISDARQKGVTLLCTPELCISGYGAEDAFLWPETARISLEVLREVLPHTRGMIVAVGLPIVVGDSVYNGGALLVDGELLGIALKRHLAGKGLHYEPRWFKGWPAGTKSKLEVFDKTVPVGDLLFEIGGLRLGFEICEDAWVEPRPARSHCGQGAELILSPSASHFSFRKFSERRQLVQAVVAEYGPNYIYCNLLGNEAGRAIYDGDAFICGPGIQGPRVFSHTRRFSFAPRQLACAQISWKGNSHLGSDIAESSRLIRKEFHYPVVPAQIADESLPQDMDEGDLSKDHVLGRVIGLGLFDYLRKSRSRGFVVSLSGGADSSATCLLVWLMLRLSTQELGQKEAILRLLGSVPESLRGSDSGLRELCHHFLLTVYQATKNSSDITRTAAREIARALGSEHHELNVESIAKNYRELTEKLLARKLSWEDDDIALQNIQARVRAPSVWMLANVRGALLLSTSNRSEAAVGYATMDGDTAGGLCPLGGVDKAYLRKWLVFMERGGMPETGPVPALRWVNEQEPTAELRPSERGQTDEMDLMPYEVLELIERLLLVDRLPLREVYERVSNDFPQASKSQRLLWVQRFYGLFAANQWKRERLAPSFHVDDANLDPKTWCRFPILSGAFRRELAELETEINCR